MNDKEKLELVRAIINDAYECGTEGDGLTATMNSLLVVIRFGEEEQHG